MIRIGSKNRLLRSGAAIAMSLVAIPAAGLGQATPDPNEAVDAEKARLEAETARINAEAARINAEAARDRARIEALNLPSFEGSTTLGEGVGAMEATMLSSHAVQEAAVTIGGWVEQSDRPVIVLAGDEALDFSRSSAIDTEISAIDRQFDQVLEAERAARRGNDRFFAAVSPTAIISAVTAAAGLLRSNTDVTAVDLPALSNRVLATAVAAELDNAIVPSGAIGPIDVEQGLLARLVELSNKRALVQDALDAIRPSNPPTESQKARMAPLRAALTRFDSFAARVTTADANGNVPIVQADRLSGIWARRPRVLRVYVDKAGGSLITRTNLLTTLGISHPVRVSGGMVASFMLTDPATGDVLTAGTITCRTTVSRLSWVQRGEWGNRRNRQQEGADCSPDSPNREAVIGPSRSDAGIGGVE